MKLLKAVLTVVLLAQNVVFASPLVVRSASEAPSSDIIERDADGNYPGDGSPGAWAVLSMRIQSVFYHYSSPANIHT